MTRDEFIGHTEKTLSELKLYAELYSGRELQNDFELEWQFKVKIYAKGKNEVVELIVDKVYRDKNNIYPCVDLIVDKITEDNRLYIIGRIARYEPREFGKGWSNRPGPFIYGIADNLIDKKVDHTSKEFKELLSEKGLLY